MAKGIIDTDILSDIAESIREKLGVDTTFKPSDMAEAIRGIITPSGTKEISITENGTFRKGVTTAKTAKITVNVEKAIEPLSVTENGVYEVPEGVDGYSPITVSVDNEIIGFSFDDIADTSRVIGDPILTVSKVYDGAFFRSGITSVTGENVITLEGFAFQDCKELVWAAFPNLSSIVGISAFSGCESMVEADLGRIKSIPNTLFCGCKKLRTMVLRSNEVCYAQWIDEKTLGGIFTDAWDSTIYVPGALVDAYTVAWSKLSQKNGVIFQPIEGSEHE